MLAARKQVFIDLLGWELATVGEHFEVDRFDDREAEYLILVDDGGRHRASARLLRTDRAHLLGDHYAHLCDGPIPRGPSIREITRFCLDRNQSAAERRSARNQLVSTLVEHAQANAITDYVGVAEIDWFSQILGFGWRCLPLGRARREGRMTLAALHIEIGETTLARLRRGRIYEPLTLNLVTVRGSAQ
ncbi:acyl homoserine lactone synthase/acyl-homoserine lactone synthase [Sphingomonas zeicaulis]